MNPLLMPALHLIVDLFKKRRLIRDEVLPLVELAESGKLDNAGRRAFVLQRLLNQGVSENDARLMLAAGLKVFRKLQAKRARKLARLTRREARDEE